MMQIPWLTRPPTPEEAAAHAKAYPILENDGVWLYVPPRHAILGPRRPQLRLLHVTAGAVWTTGLQAEEEPDARWLPYTAEGIPVCLLPYVVALGACADVTVAAMQLFASAQSALVDLLRGRGVTGNLDALALEMLAACAIDAPSLAQGNETG